MIESMIQRAFEPITKSIAAGNIPGAVLGFVDHTGEKATRCAGHAEITPTKRKMNVDTWFDLASLTKVIFTTPRILSLCETGVIALDDPISTVLKDFRQYDNDCWERKITFRQCLSHATPFPAVEPIYTLSRDPELLRAHILQREWPQKKPCYSDINFILLGFVLERIHGLKLREQDPGNGFAFEADPMCTAATENCTWRHRVLCGEVHDDNCFALQGAGHAGLFGTADAILDFASGLLSGAGASPTQLAQIQTPVGSSRTLGWEYAHEGWSGGDRCSAKTIGHTGFTGTGLWIDFDNRKAWTLLTNRIHPSRHADSGIIELRRSVSDLICGR